MAKETPIQHYRSTTSGAVPLAANLLPGEIALNLADKVAYFEDSSGGVTLLGATDKVYVLTGTAIDPENGTIQVKTLAGNTTFTESVGAGQSVVLHIIGASSYIITWPTVSWVGSGSGAAPQFLGASSVVLLWRVGSTLYGAKIGDAS